MTLLNWPKSSKLMMPNTAAQTVSAAATTSSGTPGMRSARSWPRSPVSVGGSGGPAGGGRSTPAAWAWLTRRPNTAAERAAGAMVSAGAW